MTARAPSLRLPALFAVTLAAALHPVTGAAADRAKIDAATALSRLAGFDAYLDQVVKDWNVPGIGVAVVVKDQVVFAKGFGYRDDLIWYKSDFTRKELFDRLRHLEPSQPMRQTFLYNNLMYAGAGYVIELLSGQTWEEFVRARILGPLGMTSTVFSIEDLQKQPDHGVPFTERRDSFELYRIPYYSEAAGIGPAGSMNSNLEDMSKWAAALVCGGQQGGKTVIPGAVLKATLAPAIALPNAQLESRGFGELLNAAYGTGRWTASYRGHLISYHGGDINGFHSQVATVRPTTASRWSCS